MRNHKKHPRYEKITDCCELSILKRIENRTRLHNLLEIPLAIQKGQVDLNVKKINEWPRNGLPQPLGAQTRM